VVELLIAHGADINAKDENRLTPRGIAEKQGLKELAELLRRKGGR
jgi:ankyrin repeat protein